MSKKIISPAEDPPELDPQFGHIELKNKVKSTKILQMRAERARVNKLNALRAILNGIQLVMGELTVNIHAIDFKIFISKEKILVNDIVTSQKKLLLMIDWGVFINAFNKALDDKIEQLEAELLRWR